ncbi:hypothetical protein FRX31_031493 [Thalictrum thalictroides]|uniref:Uncharacterized protein n=1 Tax=Thalictrum thalictroides TaxID=46969 RepID=A0A7J6V240_THATH|nr:hypothetical protein FRX31_031493 [Thalictrum thalictroides]
MSVIPTIFGGNRSNVFDPFSLDIWDPFDGFPLTPTPTTVFQPIHAERIKYAKPLHLLALELIGRKQQ